MRHHGEEFYYEAKAARSIADVLPAVSRHVARCRAEDRTTETLAQVAKVLAGRGAGAGGRLLIAGRIRIGNILRPSLSRGSREAAVREGFEPSVLPHTSEWPNLPMKTDVTKHP